MNGNEFMRRIVLPRLQAAPEVESVREFGIFRRGWQINLVTGEQFQLTPERVDHGQEVQRRRLLSQEFMDEDFQS